mgnify:CR=1 FL=1
MNNLNLIQENIHFVENVKLFTDVNNQIFDRIVSNLKSGQELTIDGIKVLVPNMASHLLDGIEIDYEDKKPTSDKDIKSILNYGQEVKLIKKLLKSPRELLARKVIKTINKMTRIRLFRLLLETLFQITCALMLCGASR